MRQLCCIIHAKPHRYVCVSAFAARALFHVSLRWWAIAFVGCCAAAASCPRALSVCCGWHRPQRRSRAAAVTARHSQRAIRVFSPLSHSLVCCAADGAGNARVSRWNRSLSFALRFVACRVRLTHSSAVGAVARVRCGRLRTRAVGGDSQPYVALRIAFRVRRALTPLCVCVVCERVCCVSRSGSAVCRVRVCGVSCLVCGSVAFRAFPSHRRRAVATYRRCDIPVSRSANAFGFDELMF